MIKKIFIVLVLALGVQVISGCVDCACGPSQTFVTTIKNLSASNIDSKLPEPMITNATVIKAANYGFKIQLISDKVANKNKRVNWGFIQTAYACSCVEDMYKPKESVLTLEVFSNNDFDNSRPRNIDLSAYFKVKVGNSLYNIPEYLNYINKSSQPFYDPSYWAAFLQTAPSISKMHKFRIKMTLSDGRVLETETAEVHLE